MSLAPPYRPEPGVHDEAVTTDGSLRPEAAATIEAVLERGPSELAGAVRAGWEHAGVGFTVAGAENGFFVDPVPRVIGAAEWALLETALGQRVRALNAFVDDVYGAREIVAAGAIPARVIESARLLEPRAAGLRPPGGIWIGVAGLDVVRGADGRLRVLEDNTRTPSGMGYAIAARDVVSGELGVGPAAAPRPLDDALGLLGGTLRAVSPARAEPAAIVLTDGPGNAAFWEHRFIAGRLGLPLLTPDQLDARSGRLRRRDGGGPVDVVYRRTDADVIDSPVGELLLEPLAAGTLGVVNGYGTGVADDKLVHAYVEDIVRFYLGEEPRIPSVRTFDLAEGDALAEALERLDELVVKPRHGSGGAGVVIGPHAAPAAIAETRDAIRDHPERYVAQELVMLSTHPTVVDGRLEPRHVDLRPFVFLAEGGRASVLPGGLTRVALTPGTLVVNSSQNGGAKDTWVLP
jgi:uncharacterized circularly permuted ATP-grasp superfamily protein